MDLAALIRSWCTPAPLHTLEQVYVAPMGQWPSHEKRRTDGRSLGRPDPASRPVPASPGPHSHRLKCRIRAGRIRSAGLFRPFRPESA